MTSKHPLTIKQSTEIALSKASALMDMADKILAKQSTDLVDEIWMERLWQWADDNDISDEDLPRDRDGLVNLTELNIISVNQLTELPKEICNLVNLTRLSFWSPLTKLPKEIGNLVNLTELYLDFNQLTELPKEIGNLVNLTDLGLYDNQLTELPKEIGNLVNLTYINLNGNNQLSLTTEQRQWAKNINKFYPEQL